jgi:hypothetical protein
MLHAVEHKTNARNKVLIYVPSPGMADVTQRPAVGISRRHESGQNEQGGLLGLGYDVPSKSVTRLTYRFTLKIMQARVVQHSRRMTHGAIPVAFGQLSATRLSYHDRLLGGIPSRVISVRT